MFKNSEGYTDHTAGLACNAILRDEYQQEGNRLAAIRTLIPIMKGAATLAGFEVIGRIALKDKATGKEYR